MLAAVSFHDDVFFKADKIGDEKADLLLPPEFQTVELFGFQMAPQETLCISRVFSELFCGLCQVDGNLFFPLSLALSLALSHKGRGDSF